MQADRTSHDVVDRIITLARKLNCEVVAQGIEKPAQLDRLRTLGCNFARAASSQRPSTPKPPSSSSAKRLELHTHPDHEGAPSKLRLGGDV
jgi:EAL domain-containing protein (putative c-di-GMP-specific phosphodiesterase class I)